ncbi:MAG TPA: LysR family transcriptional regulator [Clostridiales bacterium]|jgi:DNA-binding transcriptional LysR family regulator|nr:LysR family transcriptional regulator [Clostridiales bacterium]
MTLNNLYYFNEIVKDMNLSVTAERLFTTQQALSGHIKRLENYFGVRLFERTPFLVLTPEGRELQREAKLMLDAEMRLFNSFGTRPARQKGTIKIACGLARSRFYLPEIISRFTSKYPNVRITFVDENNFRDRPMFSGTDVDMAIGREPKPSTGLKVHPLMEMGGCVAISDLLLREHLGDKANEFIKKAKDGVEISELPPTIPVAHTGIAKRESWVCERIPELRERPRVYIDPENHDLLLQICREGKAILFISEIYVKYILKAYAPSFYESIHFFPHNLDGKRFVIGETLSYDASKHHPPYFNELIKLTLDVFGEMNR